MNSKIMFAIGVVALVAGAALFFIGISSRQSGSGPGAAGGAGSMREMLAAAERKNKELEAQVASLEEQLAARDIPASPRAAKGSQPGGKREPGEAARMSRVEQIKKSIAPGLAKYAKFMAKMIKAQEDGGAGMELMNDPEMLEMQADVLKAMAKLQRELGLSYMESVAGPLFMSLILEPLCKELDVALSPGQSEKLAAMSSQIVEKLLQVNENKSVFEVEKAYERMAALRGFNSEFKDFLTEEQKKKLGFFAQQSEITSSMWMGNYSYRPERAEEQVKVWQQSFGIAGDVYTGALTSIAQEYMASYGEVERRFAEADKLTDRQKEEKDREMVRVEVETLTKISQLELTREQREKVTNYNPFSPFAGAYRRTSSRAAGETAGLSKLYTLSSAQELYYNRNGRYAQTLAELQEAGMIGTPFQDDEYTIELSASDPGKWYATATPTDWSKKHFYIDETGAIHAEEGQPAGASSPLLR